MLLKRRRLLRLEWEDSAYPVAPGWMRAEDTDNLALAICKTVGWLVAEDDSRLVLASSICGGQLGGVVTIPKSAIRARKELR